MDDDDELLRRYLEEGDEEALRLWLFYSEIERKKQLSDYSGLDAIRALKMTLYDSINAEFDEFGYDTKYLYHESRISKYKRLQLGYQSYLDSISASLFNDDMDFVEKLESRSIDQLFQTYERIINTPNASDIPGWTALDWLSKFIEAGLLPPPEILQAVAGSYQQYIEAGGSATMEQAFFDPKKKGKQNYAKTLSAHNRYKQFFYEEQMLMVDDEDDQPKWSSLTEFARSRLDKYRTFDGKVLTDDEFEDYVEAFLRGYRRWKTKMRPDN